MSALVESFVRRLRLAEELIKARMEVDVDGIVAGVRARLEARLAMTPLPVDADLADKQGPFGWGRVRTWVWQAPACRKIVLSHVRMPPVIEGLALVVIPRPSRAAPVFACDLMALPTRLSVNADLYGGAELRELQRATLEPLRESFARLGSGAGPTWGSELSSGLGLHAKVSLRSVEDAVAALNGALARALDLVTGAVDGTGGPAAQERFFTAFHTHGPRRGPLGKLMGSAWAERYSRLIFE